MNRFKIALLTCLSAFLVLVLWLLPNRDTSSPLKENADSLSEIAPEPYLESHAHEASSVALVVREPVLQLCGQFGEGTIQSRREALKVLPEDLNKKELETIYTDILERSQPEGIPSRPWHAFFNDVLNSLVLEQEQPVTELPGRLLSIIQDDDRHRVIRDYALQHLLAFAEYRSEGSERLALLGRSWKAISETRDSFRGTYLVALSFKAGEPGWPAVEDISSKAWEVASADDAHILSRITALQVCGKLGHQEALPLALEIAGDMKAHMTLRTSAIATIGDLGSREEKAFLNELAGRSPPRLKVAIQAALGRIEAKRNQV